MSTSSIGLLAVFSLAVSITMAWREVASPIYRSLSVQIALAEIIDVALSPVIGAGFGVNQDAEQFRRVLLEADFELGLDIVHAGEGKIVG